MKISSESLEKADHHLQMALATAKQNDRIRAILILEPQGKTVAARHVQPQSMLLIKRKKRRATPGVGKLGFQGKKKVSTRRSDNPKSIHIKPSQFSSRLAYRKALIDQRRSSLSISIGPTIQSLRELSLEVHGGQSTRAVVVEGSASNIDRGLQLPGVRSAALDVRLDFS
jgi:hypothetical protein